MPFLLSKSMGSRFVDDCLKTHNEYRKKHGVPPLKQNKEVTAIAQKWADHLARTGSFQHSTNREFKRERLGENIAMKWSSSNEEFTGQQVANQWYEENKKYNFSRNSGAGTGHFTQMIWRDSREFGIGKAQGKDGKWIVVANYLPAGNVIGQNASNVYPVGGGKGSSSRSKPSGDSKTGKFDALFGRNPEIKQEQYTPVSRIATPTYHSDYTLIGGSSTSTSRKVTRETVNGKTITKTIITETTIGPDGRKNVVTREEITEDDAGSAGDFNRGFSRNFGTTERFGDWDSRPSNFNNNDFNKRFEELSFRNHSPRGTEYHDNGRHSPENTHSSRFGRSSPHTWEARPSSGDKPTEHSKPQKMKDFIDDVVKAHNKYRKIHGKVGDLKKNEDLDALAQKWADHLAAISVLQHSNDTYKGDQLGENVATKWGSGGADYTGQEVTDQWYSEVKKFDFNRNEFRSGTGHFTQVVWKGSKEIGVGKAFGRDGRVFVVCNYYPAGNMMGRFQENVFAA